MSTPIDAKFALAPAKTNQRFQTDIELKNTDGTNFDFTGKRVDISYATTAKGTPVLALSSAGGSPRLTLTAGNIAIDVPPAQWNLAAQTYYLDLRITAISDLTDTFLYASGTQIIEPTITALPV